jgi:hypothetical protein
MVQFSIMTDQSSDSTVVSNRIDPGMLAQLVGRFEDMVKYVVDTERKVIVVGGELHADAEEVLLESGSRQLPGTLRSAEGTPPVDSWICCPDSIHSPWISSAN